MYLFYKLSHFLTKSYGKRRKRKTQRKILGIKLRTNLNLDDEDYKYVIQRIFFDYNCNLNFS